MADIARLTLLIESGGLAEVLVGLKGIKTAAEGLAAPLEAIKQNTARAANVLEAFGRNSAGAVRLLVRQMNELKDAFAASATAAGTAGTSSSNAIKKIGASAAGSVEQINRLEQQLEKLALSENAVGRSIGTTIAAESRRQAIEGASIVQQQQLADALKKVSDARSKIRPAADAGEAAARAKLAAENANAGRTSLTDSQRLQQEAIVANARIIAAREASLKAESAVGNYRDTRASIEQQVASQKKLTAETESTIASTQKLLEAEAKLSRTANDRAAAAARVPANLNASIEQQQRLTDALETVRKAYAGVGAAADAAEVKERAAIAAGLSGVSGPRTQNESAADDARVAAARGAAAKAALLSAGGSVNAYKDVKAQVDGQIAAARALETRSAATVRLTATEQALFASSQRTLDQQAKLASSYKFSATSQAEVNAALQRSKDAYVAMADAAQRAGEAVRLQQNAARATSGTQGPQTALQTAALEKQVAAARLASSRASLPDVRRANDDVSAAIRAAKAQDEHARALEKAEAKSRALASASNGLLSSVLKLAAGYVSFSTVLTTFKTIFNEAIAYEKLKLSFETLLGSQEKAVAMVDKLRTLASQTGFDTDTLGKATTLYLALGGAANNAERDIRAVAAQAAAMGQGADQIDRVVLALGQIRAKGFLSGEEVRQLANNNVKVWDYLSKASGKSVSELMDLAKKKMIDANAAIEVVLAGLQSDFGSSLDKRLSTVKGALDRVTNNLKQAYAQIGESIFEAFDVNQKVNAFSAVIDAAGRVSVDLIRTLSGLPPQFEGTANAVQTVIHLFKELVAVTTILAAVELVAWLFGVAKGFLDAKTSVDQFKAALKSSTSVALLFVAAIFASDWGRKWASESQIAQGAMLKLNTLFQKVTSGFELSFRPTTAINETITSLATIDKNRKSLVTAGNVASASDALKGREGQIGGIVRDAGFATDNRLSTGTMGAFAKDAISGLEKLRSDLGGDALGGKELEAYNKFAKSVLDQFVDANGKLYKNFEDIGFNNRRAIQQLRKTVKYDGFDVEAANATTALKNGDAATTSFEKPFSATDALAGGIESIFNRLTGALKGFADGAATASPSVKQFNDEIARTADLAKQADLIKQRDALATYADAADKVAAQLAVIQSPKAKQHGDDTDTLGALRAQIAARTELGQMLQKAYGTKDGTAAPVEYLLDQIDKAKITLPGLTDKVNDYVAAIRGTSRGFKLPTKEELLNGGADATKAIERYGKSIDSIVDRIKNLKDESARILGGETLLGGESVLNKYRNDLRDVEASMKAAKVVADKADTRSEKGIGQIENYNDLKDQYDNLKQQIEDLKKAMAENEPLAAFDKKFQAMAKSADDAVGGINTDLAELQAANDRLRIGDGFDEGGTKLRKYQQELRKIKEDMAGLDTTTTIGANAFQALDEKAVALLTTMEKLEAAMRENASLKNAFKALQEAAKKVDSSIDDIANAILNLQDANERLRLGDSFDENGTRLAKYRNELRALIAEMDKFDFSKLSTPDAIAVQNAMSAKRDSLSDSIDKLEGLQRTNDSLKKFAQDAEASLGRADGSIQSIRGDLDGLRETNERLQMGDAFVEGEGRLVRYRKVLQAIYDEQDKLDAFDGGQQAAQYFELEKRAASLKSQMGELNDELRKNFILRTKEEFSPRINGPLDENVSGYMREGFGRDTAKELNLARDAMVGLGYSTVEVDARLSDLKNLAHLRDLKDAFEAIADTIGDSFGSAFEDIITGTKGVGEAFSSMLSDINRQVIRQLVTQPISNTVTGAASGVFGKILSGLTGGGASAGGVTGFDNAGFNAAAASGALVNANGNAFNNGEVIPFARGGVVSRPITFPMSRGRTGLMGEDGPEAIMPLERGANGRLGVRNHGGGGGNVTYNITQNISTPDANSFRQGSQAQRRQARSVVG